MAYVQNEWNVGDVITEVLMDHLETQYDEAVVDIATLAATIGVSPINIFCEDYSSIGAGTWRLNIKNTQYHNYYMDNGTTLQANDGDNISYLVWMPAGTYTLQVLHRNAANSAIIDIDIDAVEVTSWDTYNAATEENQFHTEAGIVIAASGLKTVKVRADGKNGASGDYKVEFTKMTFWRTA